MLYLVLSAFLLVALVIVQAMRDQYLVVLHWPVGYFFMERGADGRYSLFAPSRFPLVLARYVRVTTLSVAQSLMRRVRSRVSHLPVAMHYR
jgi:hypothetical protein